MRSNYNKCLESVKVKQNIEKFKYLINLHDLKNYTRTEDKNT